MENIPRDLLQLSWSEKKVEWRDVLVKGVFGAPEGGYVVLMYDFHNVFLQTVDAEEFLTQCKCHNPNVEASSSFLLKQVSKCFYSSGASTSLAHYKSTDDGAVLSCKAKLEGDVPFVWTFHLKKTDTKCVGQLLTFPLMAMVQEYCEREKMLFELLKKKDEEIADYKSQDAVVSRKTLETPVFDPSVFLSQRLRAMENKKSHGPTTPVSCFGSESCRHAYEKSVYITDLKEATCSSRTQAGETQVIDEGATQLVADGATLLAIHEQTLQMTPVESQPHTTDVSSPSGKKRQHSEEYRESVEMQRRAELQEKLAKKAEEKASKGKKKFRL